MKNSKTNKMVKIAMLAAVSALLMYIEIPLWFAPPFYEIDLSEVVVLIGAFSMGPLAGTLIELVKILVKLVLKGTQTYGVGECANFAIGCALVLPAALIYKKHKTQKGAIIGMVSGTLIMTFISCFINAYVMLPAYSMAFKMPMDAIIAMGTEVNKNITSMSTFVFLAVAPFNLLKGLIVSLLTFLLYKHVRVILK